MRLSPKEMLKKMKKIDWTCPKFLLGMAKSQLEAAEGSLATINNQRSIQLREYEKLPAWHRPMDAGAHMDRTWSLQNNITALKKRIKELEKEVANLTK